jgi:methylmalonyl-CoA mutase N-terminal domain/subunit
MDLFEVTDATTKKQLANLGQVRKQRDAARVAEALAVVKNTAQGDANLMPAIIAAVREYATVGEICRALADVFGEYSESFQ